MDDYSGKNDKKCMFCFVTILGHVVNWEEDAGHFHV